MHIDLIWYKTKCESVVLIAFFRELLIFFSETIFSRWSTLLLTGINDLSKDRETVVCSDLKKWKTSKNIDEVSLFCDVGAMESL